MSRKNENALWIYFVYYMARNADGKAEPGTGEISAPWPIRQIQQIRAIEAALSKEHDGQSYMIVNFKFLRMERPKPEPVQ